MMCHFLRFTYSSNNHETITRKITVLWESLGYLKNKISHTNPSQGQSLLIGLKIKHIGRNCGG